MTFNRPSIRAALVTLHDDSVRYWSQFDTPTFFAPIGTAWSPADNVRHLTKSMRAVTTGLRMPRFVLLFAFQRPTRASRSFDQIREIYRARLALGADAGRFAPGTRATSTDPEAERARIMSFHATAVSHMCAALDRWTDQQLDARQLPHPLLGRLTVREVLLFTVYHNQHHVENVRRRISLADRSASGVIP